MEQSKNNQVDAAGTKNQQNNSPVKKILITLMILTLLNTLAIIAGAIYLCMNNTSMIVLQSSNSESGEIVKKNDEDFSRNAGEKNNTSMIVLQSSNSESGEIVKKNDEDFSRNAGEKNKTEKSEASISYIGQQKINTAKTQIRMLEDALAGYKLDIGEYPDTQNGLNALMKNPGNSKTWKGPYILSAIPKDPWGNDYQYTCPGKHGDFDLVSYGADGKPGGTGEDADITNYPE